MLALAMALLHEPDVLIIDELSLGLAPVMVQRLLATVQELKAQGQTMIIVEQSLNVALAVADRAIFMEKGEIRFDGPAQELAVRDDLARAVFLGGADTDDRPPRLRGADAGPAQRRHAGPRPSACWPSG